MRTYFEERVVGAVIAATTLLITPIVGAQAPVPPPVIAPELAAVHVVDMMTGQGAAQLEAQWKTMEAKIVQRDPIEGALPGYTTTYDISPHAGEAGFDDSHWPAIEAEDLAARRSGGHVAFIWYRTDLTIPERIGDFETAGTKAVLYSIGRRLRQSLGRWADAAPGRLSEPGDDPGLQHAEPPGAIRCGTAGRHISNRCFRYQRTDFGGASEHSMVPRSAARILSVRFRPSF